MHGALFGPPADPPPFLQLEKQKVEPLVAEEAPKKKKKAKPKKEDAMQEEEEAPKKMKKKNKTASMSDDEEPKKKRKKKAKDPEPSPEPEPEPMEETAAEEVKQDVIVTGAWRKDGPRRRVVRREVFEPELLSDTDPEDGDYEPGFSSEPSGSDIDSDETIETDEEERAANEAPDPADAGFVVEDEVEDLADQTEETDDDSEDDTDEDDDCESSDDGGV